jgi:2-keto-4-pentenoate hydratase/2-oxohepta-3-ene-1,7-dioic acid hydratase in catechol pathway
MKLCSFEYQGKHSYGVESSNKFIVDLRATLGAAAPQTLELFIEAAVEDSELMSKVREIVAGAKSGIDANEITWRPLLRRPGKILGVAVNNKIGQDVAHRPFANPAFFLKPNSCLVGHGQPIITKTEYGVTHPEPELAVIIGKGGKNISEANALAHVFGYSIMNDITSPGLKERDSIEFVVPSHVPSSTYNKFLSWRQVRDDDHARSIYLTYHAISKGADTFGAFGPWLVTKEEIANPNELKINSFAGDNHVFEDSMSNLVFSVERIVSHASKYFMLEPGDVIHCGTSMKPAENSKYQELTAWNITKDDSLVRVEIDGIGTLENPVEIVSE